MTNTNFQKASGKKELKAVLLSTKECCGNVKIYDTQKISVMFYQMPCFSALNGLPNILKSSDKQIATLKYLIKNGTGKWFLEDKGHWQKIHLHPYRCITVISYWNHFEE